MDKRIRRTSWILFVILVFVGFVLIQRIIYIEKKKDFEWTQAAAKAKEELMSVGDVNLDLSMDYATLKSVLRNKGYSSRGFYENAVRIEWTSGVSAIFLGTRDYPLDVQRPISLSISGWKKRFPGSICGIHLGDSVEKASAAMRGCGCKITAHNKFASKDAQLQADCRSHVGLLVGVINERIESIDINDKDYIERTYPMRL